MMLSRFVLPVLAIGSIYAGDALSQGVSLPFSPNPQSYMRYLNTLEWRDGKKRQFFGFSGCKYDNSGRTPEYGCRNAYVKISDPLGSRKCQIMTFYASPWYAIKTYMWDGKWSDNIGEYACNR